MSVRVPAEPEEPIRAELFHIERLEQHAESLARAQPVSPGVVRGRSLVRRLEDNDRVLRSAHAAIAGAIREERTITPAAVWLVDNFHVVEEQVREIRCDLPDGYYRRLPKLAAGPLAGYPRVYGLAWAFVAHTDSLLEVPALLRFVRAYQRVQPLTIGELWAVAITLRILLVENLRRAALGIVSRRSARQEADHLADRLLQEDAAAVLAERPAAPLPTAFAVQLVQRLHDHDPVVTPGLQWLDRILLLQGTTVDQIVHQEHQRQGATNVTVRNVITSMRLMSVVDWTEFFESASLVDAELGADGTFAAMDFPTRDRYRHAIDDLARGSGLSELEVTRRAIAAAGREPAAGRDPGMRPPLLDQAGIRRRADPGYHLIAGGRRSFEKEIGCPVPLRSWIPRALRAAGLGGYLLAVAACTALCVAVPLVGLATAGVGLPLLIVLLGLCLGPGSDLAIALVNRRITKQLGPLALPGLELRGGVPAHLRTLVAVPTMLTTKAVVDEQVERLEVHHLASPDDDLCFALVSDWTDHTIEHAADDDELLAAAVAGIARLNLRHGPAPAGARFLLLHRRRVWSASERKWIGWERKRGKLHELDRWLRGAGDTTFLAGGAAVPAGVRYVLTLDADTQLPRGAARRLVGKMAHPLNRPGFDLRSGRVVEGHAVLQPRITPLLPLPGEGSLFQRVHSGPGGVDPYACAVSDVYQDLLGEGSYTGKGIYDIDVFEAAQEGRVPAGTVLSHDLLEGIFARAGLASDIELIEDFPTRYDVAAARQHRWARGDWQLLPWIFGRGRGRSGPRARAAIPCLGRWKMLDNLRRTLVPLTTFAVLVIGWTLGLVPAAITTGFVVAAMALPGLLPLLAAALPTRRGIPLAHHLRGLRADAWLFLAHLFFTVAFLAHQALLMSDAIVRTLFRMGVCRRLMLEWLTAAQAKFRLPLDVLGFCRRMAGSMVLAALALILVVLSGSDGWPIALPVVALWLAAPLVAQAASRKPAPDPAARLDPTEALLLRAIARRTWEYFTTFVSAGDNLLPPDNFQEDPEPVVAHRTSPTNIGLYLLSVTAARDFGWIGTREAVARIRATLDTVERLEHHRGHLFNWYDTRTLQPLEPRYVSTVDSGNLAGHLIALIRACREMVEEPVVNPARHAGIADAFALLHEAMDSLPDHRQLPIDAKVAMLAAMAAFAAACGAQPVGVAAAAAQLAQLELLAGTVLESARQLAAERIVGPGTEVVVWAMALHTCIQSHRRDLDELLPWAGLAAGMPGSSGVGTDGAHLLASNPSPSELPDRCEAARLDLVRREQTRGGEIPDASSAAPVAAWLDALGRSAQAAREFERSLAQLEGQLSASVAAMDFTFLFDERRQLLSIGYQVLEGRLDPSCYDLLASEARLASFVAIAKGDLPAKHWFRLGRGLTPVPGGALLLSWSGSLFEYLMPGLVLREPDGSLLAQTSRLVVRRQRQYGDDRGVPWGVSESAYNVRDLALTYQYSSFGLPGLGQKRGLGADHVVAPYATALAVMVDPHAAVANFSRLKAVGARGRYGFYDALDYTSSRLPPGAEVAIVRNYMAHHQGMTVVAIGNALHGGRMRARFHAAPCVQATDLLLQERVPRGIAMSMPYAVEVEIEAAARSDEIAPATVRRFQTPHDPIPRTQLLSNGGYAVMVTVAGSGYSRWRDLAVTRWREDVTRDAAGTWIYLRDMRSGAVWSAGQQPTGVEADSYEVAFSEGRAEIVRRDGSLQTTLEVTVSPEHDAEVRRVSVTNLGSQDREIELTSYAEIVLGSAAADTAHPAFAKLFVQTEHVASLGALVATRRRRTPAEPEMWAAHLAVVEGETVGALQYETDRMRFLGRGRTTRSPVSVMAGQALTLTVGTVLDPVFSLRHRLRIPPGATVRVAFWTMVASTRSEVLELADQHRDPCAFERAAMLAWTQAQVQLQHRGIDHDEAHLFQQLANRVLYSDPSLRPSVEVLKHSNRGPASLWAHGISGDQPIVLVRISEVEDLEIVRQLLRAHEFWRQKQLTVDLVILNERTTSYTRDLHDALEALVRASQPRLQLPGESASGRVFVLRTDLIAAEARGLLQSVARAVLVGRRGSLAEQLRRRQPSPEPSLQSAWRTPALPLRGELQSHVPPPVAEFWNGLGGFTAGGREYTVMLGTGQCTPAPWINVIANPSFGCQVSAEGGGYTWSVNSRENQITAWTNDPTGDASGEVIYLCDLDSGVLWCPTALPIRTQAPYLAHHGQGYTRFTHDAHGIGLELLQFVPLADPIKISRLRIRNLSRRFRRLSVTAYVEWVLGTARGASAHHVITDLDGSTKVLLARNAWRPEFGQRVAFVDLGGRQTSWTCDRTEFLGRNGALDHPRCFFVDEPLSGRVGAGLDPCSALQATILLEPGAQTEVDIFLGEAATREQALALVARYRLTDLDEVLAAVAGHWNGMLDVVQVKTPDRALDLLLNRWLLYQTLACRLVARSAFYQSGGAYGFRDQLQDGMALVVARPELTREHLLRAAEQQFVAGDVQHWWLPHTGRGVRTRIVDDCLWLVHATTHYVDATGDHAVLEVIVPFLEAEALGADEHERYFLPETSDDAGSLFEHCARALDRSLTTGAHGLPLIGTGDWNDGMNRVGAGGRGESVWMAWFLHENLTAMVPLALARGESTRAAAWQRHAGLLVAAIEQQAWDGQWYRRAYFDDGSPLGSAGNDECRIDSIVQSWAVLSGAGDPARARVAMDSVDEHLVRREDGLIRLFTPPFDRSPQDPGYVKSYPPGIRENGGQYTHAAAWVVMAFAKLGDGNRAAQLFSLLNPILRTARPPDLQRYKVEPYVACADVYSSPPLVGRGGWTWYTGSAAWLYRAGLESILGFRVQGEQLLLDPCVPEAWRSFEITYRHRSTRYHIVVDNPRGVNRGLTALGLDGAGLPTAPALVPLVDDGGAHEVRVELG